MFTVVVVVGDNVSQSYGGTRLGWIGWSRLDVNLLREQAKLEVDNDGSHAIHKINKKFHLSKYTCYKCLY